MRTILQARLCTIHRSEINQTGWASVGMRFLDVRWSCDSNDIENFGWHVLNQFEAGTQAKRDFLPLKRNIL